MTRVWFCLLLLLSACSGQVRHPLDDSETRPPDANSALTEARTTLDAVGNALLPGVRHEDTEWIADDGCDTSTDSPEQGDVSRILRDTYPALPPYTTAGDVVASAQTHWEGEGHTVGAGSPDMSNQFIVRVNGISYAVVEVTPGVELRAFLPCYEIQPRPSRERRST